jgi:hypothetical protein
VALRTFNRLNSPQTHQEGRLRKSAIRLLTLAIYGAAFVVVPVTMPAKAATNGNGEVAKDKKIQKGAASNDPRPSKPAWPPPMYEDFDRKNTGGGGGM